MKKMLSFSKEYSNVFFHILTQCNLTCRHCYINPKQHGSSTLNIKTIFSWLELFVKNSKKNNIIFLGGEPTIHPKLPIAIKKARELGYDSIVIDTNGYGIKNILNSISVEDVDFLNFSLDGATAQSNDILRGKGSYACCVKAIYEAKKKGFRIGLIFTVSIANLNWLNKMPEFLASIGVDHFFIQVIGIRGLWSLDQKKRKELGQVNDKSWLRIIPNVAQRIVKSGIAVTYPKMFLRSEEIFECFGLTAENYFVFPNGRVYLCPLCEDYPLHSKEIIDNVLVNTGGLNEKALFNLNIPEGCVMNRIIQPNNICCENGQVKYRIACCMSKEELLP